MEYLTPKELQKMILFSWEKIEKNKEEINKINVFPVPDQDTGSNMAKTLLGIKEAIENKDFKNLEEISEAALDGALTAAQGNAGVIYTGFLAGFLPQLNNNSVGSVKNFKKNQKNNSQAIDAKKIAQAFQGGAQRARESIQNPREGTILDVIDAAANTFQKESQKEKEITSLFQKAVENAQEALLATREKMEIFRKANVVDAGGLGFLMILESYLESLEGEKKKKEKEKTTPSEKIKRFIQTLSQRYEVVFLIENKNLNPQDLEKKLVKLGNSIEIVKIGQKTKVHIHTDFPDEVKEIARQSGKMLSLRVEDMAKEVGGEPSVRKISIGIVVDDAASLLPKIQERYQIAIVPTIVDWPEGKKIKGKNIYQKMREAEGLGIKTLPKISQADSQEYLNVFEQLLQKFEKVLCITVASKLSGCHNAAMQAEKEVSDPKRVFVFDSQQALGAQAFLILRAIEMIQEQREVTEIIKELQEFRLKTYLYGLLEDPKWIRAGGKITKSQANWIRRMKKLGFHPLITIKKGQILKGGIVFAQGMAEVLFKKIKKDIKIRKREQGVRVIINYTDNLKEAEKLKKKLKEINVEVSFMSLVNPVVGVHLGPGGLIASWAPLEEE